MSPHRPRLVHSQVTPVRPQISWPKGFAPEGGRGRGQRRPLPVALPILDREAAGLFWAGLIRRRCGDVPGIVRVFACREQTARNWLDQHCLPSALHMMEAMRRWPEDFAALQGYRGF